MFHKRILWPMRCWSLSTGRLQVIKLDSIHFCFFTCGNLKWSLKEYLCLSMSGGLQLVVILCKKQSWLMLLKQVGFLGCQLGMLILVPVFAFALNFPVGCVEWVTYYLGYSILSWMFLGQKWEKENRDNLEAHQGIGIVDGPAWRR